MILPFFSKKKSHVTIFVRLKNKLFNIEENKNLRRCDRQVPLNILNNENKYYFITTKLILK
jgi:hypothetical protein